MSTTPDPMYVAGRLSLLYNNYQCTLQPRPMGLVVPWLPIRDQNCGIYFILVKVIFTIQNTDCLKIYMHTLVSAASCMYVGIAIYHMVANCPDIGGTVTIFAPLSCVPPSAMIVPTFRKDWHSNWIRLVISRTDDSASTCARELAN